MAQEESDMGISTCKADLPPAGARLVELMQGINFGRIEDLSVTDGVPVLCPPPRVIREVKFGAENGPRPEAAIEDFLLKSQVVEFFDQLSRLGDGVVESVEVRHGLPFRMTVREPARL